MYIVSPFELQVEQMFQGCLAFKNKFVKNVRLTMYILMQIDDYEHNVCINVYRSIRQSTGVRTKEPLTL